MNVIPSGNEVFEEEGDPGQVRQVEENHGKPGDDDKVSVRDDCLRVCDWLFRVSDECLVFVIGCSGLVMDV